MLLKIVSIGLLALTAPISAAVIGQVDNFEDGTTQGWGVALLGSPHPAPPANVASGGPAGVNDNYLRLTAVGGNMLPGNRLVAINAAQWAGDYLSAGITSITMDLRNLGATDLNVRLYLENPSGGPPTDDAVTSSVFLAAGGGWVNASFAVNAAALTSLQGNVNTLLSNVTAIRILHNPAATFPGPSVAALLGVDNITAAGAAAAIPEPLTGVLVGAGLAAIALRRRG